MNNPFSLKFITNRISKCQGCKGSLRNPDNSLPTVPDDLIVSCMECRPFVASDGTVKVPAKPSASHYHLNIDCLTAASASFDPNSIVLPSRKTLNRSIMLYSPNLVYTNIYLYADWHFTNTLFCVLVWFLLCVPSWCWALTSFIFNHTII